VSAPVVSAQPTFGAVFLQACQRSSSGAGVAIASADSVLATLARCGSHPYCLEFSNRRISFTDRAGRDAEFSWEQLDFILPFDLSLASDKLYAFSDMDAPAERIARIVGVIFAWAAAAGFAYFVAVFLYDWVIYPLWWLHSNWGWFGDTIDVALIAGFFMFVGWWLLALIAGLFASGGAIASLALWFGRLLRPLIKLGLTTGFRGAENGLHIIDRDWVGMPWEPQAARALDLIFIGVKLRRRGLT